MATIINHCICGNVLTFEVCCKPIIDGKVAAKNAEILMRSRFSAYSLKNYQYILQTYILAQRSILTISELADSAQNTQWLSLQVIAHHSQANTAQVEFKAFYQIHNSYYVMHEISDFVFEAGTWLYADGIIKNDSGELSQDRNSQCLCGSGKKYKKCCGR